MYSQAKMVHSTTPHHISLQLNFNTHCEPTSSFFLTITHLADNIKIMQFSILLMSGALMLINIDAERYLQFQRDLHHSQQGGVRLQPGKCDGHVEDED